MAKTKKPEATPKGLPNSAEIGFEKQIWDAANILRGNIDASEYKHVILGLIFLKYLSDKFEDQYKELKEAGDGLLSYLVYYYIFWAYAVLHFLGIHAVACFLRAGFEEDRDAEDRRSYDEQNVFYVPVSARWKKIAAKAHTPEIGKVIDDASDHRSAVSIEKENTKLKGVLPKNFARPELDKRRLGEVVDLFTNITMTAHGDTKDILGRTYEYCLGQFAEQEGSDFQSALAGEFYTPACVVRTLVEVIQPLSGRVYDPCCGSGGMFVQSAKFVESHQGNINKISIFGQDSNPTTWKLCQMNLAIRGIEADLGEAAADTFSNDQHPSKKMDFILANPPFNISNWGGDKLQTDIRWKYGVPPAGNANFAWLQHMIHHLSPKGRIGMVLANGSLSSQSGNEGEIRKAIIEDDLLEGIVAMPPNLFYTATVPVALWFINRKKAQCGKSLFIDARNMGTMVTRRLREMTDGDIAKIADTFDKFANGKFKAEKEFSAVVKTTEIAKQDYILTPGRYVGLADQADDGEAFDEKMGRLTAELAGYFDESHKLEKEIKKRLGAIGWEI